MSHYKHPSIEREVWYYNNADWQNLNFTLHNVNWHDITANDFNINEQANFVTSTYLKAAKKHIPIRKIRVRSKDKPWVTPKLREMIRLCNRWSGTYNRTKREDHKVIRNRLHSQVKQELCQLKKHYFENQLQKLNDPQLSCKKFWNIAKQLYGNKIKQPVPTLIDNGKHYSTDVDKAELLNEYFADQSTLLPTPDNFQLPEFSYLTEKRLDSIPITPYQVNKVMKSLKTNKTSGPDQISNTLLKHTAKCYVRTSSSTV